jgi:hypothetical protein
MAPVAASSEPQVVAATTFASVLGDAPEAMLERVARSLRGARIRTGLSESQIVALLTERGVAISVAMLRRAERTGAIDLALAACLADSYGTTIDGLAGRRLYCRLTTTQL